MLPEAAGRGQLFQVRVGVQVRVQVCLAYG